MLARKDILEKILAKFPELEISPDPENQNLLLLEQHDQIHTIIGWLKKHRQLAFDYLEFQTCSDEPPEHLKLVYYLYSFTNQIRIGFKLLLDRANPQVPSICEHYENANWNEREVYDLFGVHFEGHPELKRIMMPENWEGHPLRKDYLHPNVVKRPD